MPYKTVFVPILEEGQLDPLVDTASTIAHGWGSHLRAGYFAPPPAPQAAIAVDGGAALSSAAYIDEHRALHREIGDAMRQRFLARLRAARLPLVSGDAVGPGPAASWTQVEADATGRFAREARTADLSICASLSRDRTPFTRRAFESVVETGAPVLLCGPVAMRSAPRWIALAWDGRDECASAMRAALPILKRASRVDILTAGPLAANAAPPAEARVLLARHGVTAECRTLSCAPKAWDGVCAVLREDNHDLLVMGVYSTPRMAEFVFGGFTRSALVETPCPLLLSQ